jgi:hypothetical protein
MKYRTGDMIRFVRGPIQTVDGWDDTPVTANTAHVPERPDMEDTGLLDSEGRRLYREREPFGFKPR